MTCCGGVTPGATWRAPVSAPPSPLCTSSVSPRTPLALPRPPHPISPLPRLALISAQVAVEFRYTKETTAVAINYLDRALSKIPVAASHLQVAALACMSLASKQHEARAMGGQDLEMFSEIATPRDIRIAEQNTLFALEWDANTFTPLALVDLLLSLVPDPPLVAAVKKTAEDFFDVALTGELMRCRARAWLRRGHGSRRRRCLLACVCVFVWILNLPSLPLLPPSRLRTRRPPPHCGRTRLPGVRVPDP
jgi:hypothetical protein